ncbi:MAG: glycosyltransferase [Pseudomonadota bacterium]
MGKHFLWQRGLVREVLRADYDAIILLGNMYFLSTWFALFLARLKGKKTLLWTHGVRSKETGVKRLFREFFYRCSDGLLLYGNRARDILGDQGVPVDRMTVIFNSLDFDRQLEMMEESERLEVAELIKPLVLQEGEKYVLMIGRLTQDKAPELLLEAISDIVQRGEAIKAVVVGSGPRLDLLKQLCLELKLQNHIHLFGECYDEKTLAALHLGACVAVVPGDIGLSAIHSLGYGVPVLTHNDFDRHKPEFEAIEAGVTGDFFEFGDAVSLADHILDWKRKSAQSNEMDVRQSCISKIAVDYHPAMQRHRISGAVRKVLRS